MPLHRQRAADRQYLETAKVPWPRCRRCQCQQMEPKIMAAPGFLCKTLQRLLLGPLLCDILFCCHSFSQIFLLFSWKSIREGCCTKAACQMTASKKKTLKALPVVLLSPMKLNYSFACAGNTNVIADFLNKQCHHYNNHQDFCYFWPFL